MDGGGRTRADGGVEKSVILAPIKMLTSEAGLWTCCVRTCCVRRPANGLSADALVVSVKIKIKKLTRVVSVDTEEVVVDVDGGGGGIR